MSCVLDDTLFQTDLENDLSRKHNILSFGLMDFFRLDNVSTMVRVNGWQTCHHKMPSRDAAVYFMNYRHIDKAGRTQMEGVF